jgi:hypothetical protein
MRPKMRVLRRPRSRVLTIFWKAWTSRWKAKCCNWRRRWIHVCVDCWCRWQVKFKCCWWTMYLRELDEQDGLVPLCTMAAKGGLYLMKERETGWPIALPCHWMEIYSMGKNNKFGTPSTQKDFCKNFEWVWIKWPVWINCPIWTKTY